MKNLGATLLALMKLKLTIIIVHYQQNVISACTIPKKNLLLQTLVKDILLLLNDQQQLHRSVDYVTMGVRMKKEKNRKKGRERSIYPFSGISQTNPATIAVPGAQP